MRFRKKERKGKERKGKERERKGKGKERKKKGGEIPGFKNTKKKDTTKSACLGNKGGKCETQKKREKKRKEEKGRERNGQERKRKGGGEGWEGKKNTQIPNITFQKYKKEREHYTLDEEQPKTPNKRLLPPFLPSLLFDRKGEEGRRGIPQYAVGKGCGWCYNLRVF